MIIEKIKTFISITLLLVGFSLMWLGPNVHPNGPVIGFGCVLAGIVVFLVKNRLPNKRDNQWSQASTGSTNEFDGD